MAYNSFTGSGITGSSSQFNTDEVNMLSNSLANNRLNTFASTSQVNAEGRRIYARVSSPSQMNRSGRQTQSQISSTYQRNTGENQMQSQFSSPSQMNTSGRQMQSQFSNPSNMNSSGMSMPSRNPSPNLTNTGGNLMQSQFSSPSRINTSGRQMQSQFSSPSNMNSIQTHMQPQIPSPYQTNTRGNQKQSQFSSFSQMNTSGRQMQSQLSYPSDMNSCGMPMPFQVSSPYPKSGNQMQSHFSSSSQIDTKGMQMQSKFSPNSQMSTGENRKYIDYVKEEQMASNFNPCPPFPYGVDVMEMLSDAFASSSLSQTRGILAPSSFLNPLQMSSEELLMSYVANMLDSDEDSDDCTSDSEDDNSDEDFGQQPKGKAMTKGAKGISRFRALTKSERESKLRELKKSLNPLKSFRDASKGRRPGKRGWVLIIVNYSFDDRDIKDLPRGDEIEKLTSLFEEFNYHVRSFENLSKRRILEKIEHYASKQHSKSFLCFISSHGDVSSITCRRGSDVNITDMYKRANQPSLKGLPKCFFFDTCRVKESKGYVNMPAIPSDNFFVGLSCLAGKYSYVGKKRYKNVYLGYLHEIFNESFRFPPKQDTIRDIEYLIKKVSRDVQKETGQKPMYESSLTKMLFLQGGN